MKAASLSEIKKELKTLDAQQTLELCMRLAKYKKENKELLHYLLFEATNEQHYASTAKEEVSDMLGGLSSLAPYFAKKAVRKALRTASKYIKYSGSKQTEADLLIHFCKTLKQSGLAIHRYTVLQNLYNNQLKKIQKALSTLHEDVQGDYAQDLAYLGLH